MKTMRFIGIVLALFSAGSPPAAQAQDSGKKYKVYMVSNSHLDTQWRWDVKATIDDYLYNTAVQNLALLEKYPHYVFNFEGAVKYEWIKEYYPHLFERIRKLSVTSCLHRSFIKRSSASSRRICSCPTVSDSARSCRRWDTTAA